MRRMPTPEEWRNLLKPEPLHDRSMIGWLEISMQPDHRKFFIVLVDDFGLGLGKHARRSVMMSDPSYERVILLAELLGKANGLPVVDLVE